MNASNSFDLDLEQFPEKIKTLYLAYSGGIDSSVLLHVLRLYQKDYRIVIWHINHGLQDNAQIMENFARQQAARFQFECRVDRLNMDPHQGNLESQARDLRYRLFEQQITQQDVLMTAHHKNDQAETLLLNLMRGSGASGLRAIASLKPLGKGLLLRPLLRYSRQQIELYADQNKLEWIEDPSNKNTRFDRNYLRHKVLPLMTERWPSAISQIQRVSELQNESEQLQTDLAKIDYATTVVQRPFSDFSCLSINALQVLSYARQKNLIRYWIRHNELSVIGFHRIEELLRQIMCRVDALPVIEGTNFQIRVYKKYLYLLSKRQPARLLKSSYKVPVSGSLTIQAVNLCVDRSAIFNYLKCPDEGRDVFIKFRQNITPGKKCNHSHTLKRLFQKHQIPPWKRNETPLIYIGDDLIGLWLNY